MSVAGWMGPEARRAIADRVRDIESTTAAEVVVTVRARSAEYRHVEVAVGAAFGLLAVLVYVYAPITFVDDLAPLAIAVAFVAGMLLTNAIAGLKRPLVSRKARRLAVRLASRAAFVDQGIARTQSRKGVLVYLSLFEREVEVVPDVGVDVGAMGEAWSKAIVELEVAFRRSRSVAEVVTRLDALGAALAAGMPITPDDVNELPDEVAS